MRTAGDAAEVAPALAAEGARPRTPAVDATLYLLAAFPVGMFWFIVVVLGVAVGVSLTVVWVGLPLLAATAVACRAATRGERALLRSLLGVDIPLPYRQPVARGLAARWRGRAADPATWKDLAYLVLLFPLGIVWFSLALTAWSVTAALVTLPLWYGRLPGGRARLFEVGGQAHVVIDSVPKALAAAAIGVALAGLARWLVIGCAHAHAAIARSLLGPSQAQQLATQARQLDARAEVLRSSRDRAAEAAGAERRRIERDLHDGAQQRLVALAMDLGMAKERLAADPDAARALVEEAHTEAKRALVELRELARGIHPAVLSDRGLDAALSALAARSPVPVRIEVDTGPERLPAKLEATAYFVVAESLTNVAKHAAATEAAVRVERRGDRVVVEVRDDGAGGAAIAAGGGLAGLADRVAGADGTLTVASPPGGPTTVRAELPCAS